MPKTSAGILMYRLRDDGPEILLVHPGGPFWRNKDLGAWSVPKGEVEEGADPLTVAKREFEEETGARPEGELTPIGEIRQKGGKRVVAWALEGDLDPESLESNTFTMEWPPGSGTLAEFPEVDRAAWFDLDEARSRILPSQLPLLERLERNLVEERGENE